MQLRPRRPALSDISNTAQSAPADDAGSGKGKTSGKRTVSLYQRRMLSLLSQYRN